MWDDPAVALVCGYLRVNGYFTLTEFEVTLQKGEEVTAVTDLDVIAVRLPTNRERPVHPSDVRVRSDIVATVDPALHVAEDRLDVLIVEVKQGHIEFNPGMFRPATLHAGLRRVGGDLGASAAEVVDELVARGRFESDRAQVRLLAVGSHGRVSTGTSVTHAHILRFLDGHVRRHADVLKAIQTGDPVISFLELVQKSGGLPST